MNRIALPHTSATLSNGTSTPYPLYGNPATVGVSPAGTVVAQTSVSKDAVDTPAGAVWVDWDAGTLATASNEFLQASGVVAIRFVVAGGDCDIEING